MTDTVESQAALEDLNARLKVDDMVGQWTFEPQLTAAIGGPKPRGRGHVWPWRTVGPRLQEASEVLGPTGVGRCNLTFVNPGIRTGPAGSTHTISAGVQMMREHEVCWSHRHSMAALRFIIDGDPRAYTAVDGEKLPMGPHDLLLTPRFSWHDHHNPTDQPVTWLDVLDLGLNASLNTVFYEPFGEASQPLRETMADTQGLRASSLRPTWEATRTGRAPLHYKWSDVLDVLDGYGERHPGNPYDGLALRYANPVTGGPTLPTMDCWLQQLPAGFEGSRHRRTSSSVGYVVSGYGAVEIGGRTLTFGPRDTFAIPNYAWHRFINPSNGPVRIFAVHDIPALQSLGLFYEEPTDILNVTPAPPVPAVPHDPHYRPTALLDSEESR